jgi:hypothetical protein
LRTAAGRRIEVSELNPEAELIAKLRTKVRGLEEQLTRERVKRDTSAAGASAQLPDLTAGGMQPRDLDEEHKKLLEERDRLVKGIHVRRERIRQFLEQHPSLPVHEKSPLIARLAQIDADERKLVWKRED